jgi:hypothetical protein
MPKYIRSIVARGKADGRARQSFNAEALRSAEEERGENQKRHRGTETQRKAKEVLLRVASAFSATPR